VVMLANVSEDTDDYVLIAEELVLMDKWFWASNYPRTKQEYRSLRHDYR
jgi:hypothetical protein